jgi:hypothetical protein
MILKITNLFIVVAILSPPICAQKSNLTQGWDLTYSSVLERNNIGRSEWIWKWLGPNYESPAKKLISAWQGEPIVSSILIEMPAPHAGEHIGVWLIRTEDHAYSWEFVEDQPPGDKETVKPQLYDKLFAKLSPWQQAKPSSVENTSTGGVPGYMGFLNLYDRGKSRQMLLSQEDFVICDTKECKNGKPGRLSRALEPIIDLNE